MNGVCDVLVYVQYQNIMSKHSHTFAKEYENVCSYKCESFIHQSRLAVKFVFAAGPYMGGDSLP